MIHNWPAEDVRDLPEPTGALKERRLFKPSQLLPPILSDL